MEYVCKLLEGKITNKMDKFLVTYNLPKLNYEERENLNITITSKETESLIKTSQ